jgi:hypothetical protein
MAQPDKIFRYMPDHRDGLSQSQPSPAYGASFEDAITALGAIIAMRTHRFLRDSTHAESLPHVSTAKDVTDAHFVHLARRYRLKLATFDVALCEKEWARGVAEDPTR